MTKDSLAIGRAGQPIEVATAVVFLASVESSYFTAQVSRVESSRGGDKSHSPSQSLTHPKTFHCNGGAVY
jgi:hypothetical protein